MHQGLDGYSERTPSRPVFEPPDGFPVAANPEKQIFQSKQRGSGTLCGVSLPLDRHWQTESGVVCGSAQPQGSQGSQLLAARRYLHGLAGRDRAGPRVCGAARQRQQRGLAFSNVLGAGQRLASRPGSWRRAAHRSAIHAAAGRWPQDYICYLPGPRTGTASSSSTRPTTPRWRV